MADLDDHITNALRGTADLRRQVRDLTVERDQLLQTVSQLDTERSMLREHIKKTEANLGHHVRWNAELVTQMNNVGMFVNDAMQKAKVGAYRGSGQVINEEALAAVANAVGVEQERPVPQFLVAER